MKKWSNTLWKGLKEYSLITVGLLLYVLGWTVFLVPNNMVGGGVTGAAAILQYATGGVVKIGYTYLAVNVLLLAAALFTLGKSFGAKTVYAILLVSYALNLFQNILPADLIESLSRDNGPLMCTIMGGIMTGIGVGVTMSQGGSTGGTDIIALIVNKYRNVSPGRMLLTMDVIVILSSVLVPSVMTDGQLMSLSGKITRLVLGLILIVVNSTALDLFLTGSKQSVQLFILTHRDEEIASMVSSEFRRGVTLLNGEGWYTKQPIKMIMVLTRKTDLTPLLKRVRQVDSNAFISVSNVTGVYGIGFEVIKQGLKKPSKLENVSKT